MVWPTLGSRTAKEQNWRGIKGTGSCVCEYETLKVNILTSLWPYINSDVYVCDKLVELVFVHHRHQSRVAR